MTNYDQRNSDIKVLLGTQVDVKNLCNSLGNEKLLHGETWIITIIRDEDITALNRKINDWVSTVETGDDVFIFCGSHGVKYANSHFIVPIQKKPLNTVEDLLTRCLSVSRLIVKVGKKMPRIKVFLIDACTVFYIPTVSDR